MIAEILPPADEAEAYKTLVQRVGRRGGKLPAELLARHVMGCVPATEWPVRAEALDAVLRRLEAGRKDDLRLAARPPAGGVLGQYATKRRNSDARPYDTVLLGVDPIEARCDCPDFLKNSLALCKHVLAVLDYLHARPKLLRQATSEAAERGSPPAGLNWHPIRPLTGEGDWLDRVTLTYERASNGRGPAAIRWFRSAGAGKFVLKQVFGNNRSRRLELVEDLLKLAQSGSRSAADPALLALLAGERERLRKVAKLAVTPPEIRAGLKGLKRTLYPYQIKGVERFLTGYPLLLADDMGLGKTAQAIAATDILWRTRRIKRGLIIAPASLKPQWAREWASFSHLPIEIVEGTPSERQELYDSRRTGLFIINYEQLIRDLETIRRWRPDLVVLDEAQRIKNWATKTALSVKRLTPQFRLVLTGTPMENRIDELASIVEWVDDMAMEPKWRLNALHSVRSDGRSEVTGVRHLDTIRARLRACMLRRVRQDVLDQLPPRTDTRVPIEWTEEQRFEHDSLIQPIASILQRAKSRSLTQPEFLRLMSLLTTQRIISNGLAQLNFEEVWPSIRSREADDGVLGSLSAPKLGELRQLIRNLVIDQGRKVVVFSQWRRMLALAHWAVADLIAKQNLRAGFFTGAEGPRRRTQNIVEFHDDPAFRILFASDAGGVGLNLQHASNCVINLEMPWNPAVLEQRIGRVYRLGQSKPIDVFNLVCEQGIESRIAGLVGSKQAMFKGLFDGDTDAVQFEEAGSFLSRVEKIYEPSVLEIAASASIDDGAEEEIADSHLDDEVADPFEEMLEVADESRDEVAAPAQEPVAVPRDATPVELPSEAQPSRFPDNTQVRRLFSQLRMRREGDGKVVIEAPPEAATTLSDLFEGLAAMLRAASEESATP